MPQIRQQITVDALANFSVTAGITSFYIYNIQLTYQLIDFGQEVQNMVMSMPILRVMDGRIQLQLYQQVL